MFSKSSSTSKTTKTSTTTTTDTTNILATNITMEQLGERHMELVRAANGRRRKTGKHEWTHGEHTDLSLTFLRDCEAKSLHQIAQDIHARFAEYLTQQDQGDESDDDAPLVGPGSEQAQAQAPTEYREGLPSVSAIEMKLIHCVLLHRNCKNAKSKLGTSPSMMHAEVWQHLLQAQKHREMIRTMKPAVPALAPTPSPVPTRSSRLGKVHRRKESECDRADFPSAKRRKLNPEDYDQTQCDANNKKNKNSKSNSNSNINIKREEGMNMQELREALDRIGNHVEVLRQNKDEMELLTGYMQDMLSIVADKCVKRIDTELAKIQTFLQVPTPTPAAAPACDDNDDYYHNHDYYNVDGHEVSAWIYNEDYDEPRRGDYDHGEECS